MTAATVRSVPAGRVRAATAGPFAWAAVKVAWLVIDLWLISICRGAGIGVKSWSESVASGAAIVVGSAVGATIAARLPRNPVGWLVLTTLCIFTVSGTLQFYGQAGLLTDRQWTGGATAAAIDQSLWLIVFGVIAMMLLIYPDGRPPAGARWGGVARGITIVFPLAFGWGLFGAHQRLDPPVHAFRNPLAVRALESPLTEVVNVVLLVGCFGLLLASAASVAVRYRNGERPALPAQMDAARRGHTARDGAHLPCRRDLRPERR